SYVSPSCESVLGYKPEELIGQRPNIVHPDDSDLVQKIFSQALQGGSSPSFQYRIQTKKGETKWISHVFTTLKQDNRLEMIVSTLRDLTDIKLVEKELFEKISLLENSERATLNIMDDLQDSIGRLLLAQGEISEKNEELQTKTEDLTAINEELHVARGQLSSLNQDLEQRVRDRTREIEKLLKQKDEFIGQLGHDLKTPLTPLNTLLPIIKKREQDPKLVELLDVTIQNVNHMKNLVVKTLQLARLNSSNVILAMTEFPLSIEIKKAVESIQRTLQETGIILESNLDDSIIVNADLLQMRELIDNLLSNAMKYTPPGGKITVSTVQAQDSVITTIQDTGVGLTVEQLEHLFEEFYKADPSRHDLQSTGLGLAISKRIVEKHGGKIWAESPGPGKGAAFHFTMKISDDKLNKPQKDKAIHTTGEKKE
ncbi:MAG: ATP-binding protein, partial [Euryarchaeota archaeon]|nr:ATP-binding protein [Euryarchaeota archaeon]